MIATLWSPPTVAVAAAPAKEEMADEVTALPLLIVSEKRFDKLQWLHGEMPGYEVLSLCSFEATEAYLRATSQLNREFTAVAPPNFQVRSSAPAILIVLDADIAGELSKDMAEEMAHRVDKAEREAVAEHSKYHLSPTAVLPNLQLWERDSAVIFCILRDFDWSRPTPSVRLTLPEERERFLLGNRRPALPAWYTEAAIDLFNTAKMSGHSIIVPHAVMTDPEQMTLLSSLPGHIGILDQPTDEDGFPTGLFLIRMEKFLTEGLPPVGVSPQEQAYRQAWLTQADFFMRCALDEAWNRTAEKPFPTGSFWKFVERASSEPVSEALCKECFGCNYSGLEERLVDYMDFAAKDPTRLPITASESEPKIDLHYATKLEIARLKGEWDRRLAKYVRRKFPDALSMYEDVAEHTLMASYKRGERDPGVLSSLGLLKLEANENRAAKPFLEEAVKKNINRPRPYIELAHLYYQDALALNKDRGGKLTLEQANQASAPLLAARHLEPVLPEAGELLADIWIHTEAPPPAPVVAAIDENARISGRPKLLLAAAVFDAAQKMNAKARELIALGLRSQPDEKTRARLLKLQDTVKN